MESSLQCLSNACFLGSGTPLLIDFVTLLVTVALEIVLGLFSPMKLALRNKFLKQNKTKPNSNPYPLQKPIGWFLFMCIKINTGSFPPNFGHIHSFTVVVKSSMMIFWGMFIKCSLSHYHYGGRRACLLKPFFFFTTVASNTHRK